MGTGRLVGRRVSFCLFLSDGACANVKIAIESRVARIKARVAELTGNMENGAPVAGGPVRR